MPIAGHPAFTRPRRGTMLVGVLVALSLFMLLVGAVVMAGARDSAQSVDRFAALRAEYNAEAAANMAIRELVLHSDLDANGTIGTFNPANVATLNGGTMTSAASTTAGTTTVNTQGVRLASSAASRVTVVDGQARTAGTVLLVVPNAASLSSQETAKQQLFQSWGYTVTLISESATQADFDIACRAASVVYISETVLSTNVGTKLTAANIGIVCEESALPDELGLSTSTNFFSANQINITNASHYITSPIGTGIKSIFTSSQPIRSLAGTLGGITTLAQETGNSNVTMAIVERGDALVPSGTAAGRRVFLPFGSSGMDINLLTADGLTILRRSIEWCLLPVAHYRLNDATGTTAVDAISSRNGSLINSPTWTFGVVEGGLQLDGWDDYVSIPDATAFRVTSSLTVCGWIRGNTWPSTTDYVSVMLRKGDGNPNNWQFGVRSTGRATLFLDEWDTAGISGNTTLATGNWYHIAGTWDGVNVRIYVNGVLDNTPAARAAPIATDTRAVYLGGRVGSTDVLNGVIDDVRFYNRALTAAEIAAVAAEGAVKITSWIEP